MAESVVGLQGEAEDLPEHHTEGPHVALHRVAGVQYALQGHPTAMEMKNKNEKWKRKMKNENEKWKWKNENEKCLFSNTQEFLPNIFITSFK